MESCYERRDGFSKEEQDLRVSRSSSWAKAVIIDDEDALPHDLAYSDDEDLVNVDDDDNGDVAVVYSNEED
ncbi:hypothetical protein Tco_0719069 [Tanacetum coccineum]